jgi:hypothetical protein
MTWPATPSSSSGTRRRISPAGDIGVATGRYSVAELRAHAPIAVFEDLSDTEAVVRAIVGG